MRLLFCWSIISYYVGKFCTMGFLIQYSSLFRYMYVGCHPGSPPMLKRLAWERNRSGIWNLWNAFSDAAITTCIQSPRIPHIHCVMGSGNVLAAFYRSRVAARLAFSYNFGLCYNDATLTPSSGRRLKFLLTPGFNRLAQKPPLAFLGQWWSRITWRCDVAANSFN